LSGKQKGDEGAEESKTDSGDGAMAAVAPEVTVSDDGKPTNASKPKMSAFCTATLSFCFSYCFTPTDTKAY
jgi:hypothetical protein